MCSDLFDGGKQNVAVFVVGESVEQLLAATGQRGEHDAAMNADVGAGFMLQYLIPGKGRAEVMRWRGHAGGLSLHGNTPTKRYVIRLPRFQARRATVRVGKPVVGTGVHECTPHSRPKKEPCYGRKKNRTGRFVRLLNRVSNPAFREEVRER